MKLPVRPPPFTKYTLLGTAISTLCPLFLPVKLIAGVVPKYCKLKAEYGLCVALVELMSIGDCFVPLAHTPVQFAGPGIKKERNQ